jgi:hypothetical protein
MSTANITITGCNRGKTGPMLTSDYQLIASFYFTLSDPPSEEWIHVFEQVRRARRERENRRLVPARIDERGLVVKCRPDELQKHFAELQEDVALANQDYQVLLAAAECNAVRATTLEREIEDALRQLKFDAED